MQPNINTTDGLKPSTQDPKSLCMHACMHVRRHAAGEALTSEPRCALRAIGGRRVWHLRVWGCVAAAEMHALLLTVAAAAAMHALLQQGNDTSLKRLGWPRAPAYFFTPTDSRCSS